MGTCDANMCDIVYVLVARGLFKLQNRKNQKVNTYKY